eukprot:2582922-Amphidinium_carterae.1
MDVGASPSKVDLQLCNRTFEGFLNFLHTVARHMCAYIYTHWVSAWRLGCAHIEDQQALHAYYDTILVRRVATIAWSERNNAMGFCL